MIFVIIMTKNHPASQNFFLSPILQSQDDNSPYLSPFRNPFRKLSTSFEDLIDFRLEEPLQQIDKNNPLQYQIAQEQFILEKDNQDKHMESNGLELQEAVSPNHSHHYQIPSTKFTQIKQECQPPFLQLKPAHEGEGISKVQIMIEFLIQHSHLKEDLLQIECIHFSQGNHSMQRAFQILTGKFKKLRKTKQEMTKYCMRKAFKFIAEHGKSDRKQSRDLDNCMRQYFQDANEGNFTIPFKKHSTEKTMNCNFLKRIFSCNQFCQDYKIFLNHLQSLVIEDNEKKVKYLATLVEQALQKEDPQSINKIKRLPWTRQILKQVFDLGFSLSDSPHQTSIRQPRRLNE